MHQELYKILSETNRGPRLDEVLTKAEMDVMRDQIATPEILPCDFDMTIPGWLARIEFWGKITFRQKDPESFWGWKKVSEKQFLDRISDEGLNKLFGQWSIKKNNVTKVTFHRDYIDRNNRHRQERFEISVKLKPKLR